MEREAEESCSVKRAPAVGMGLEVFSFIAEES
jgi:hypothetical protein